MADAAFTFRLEGMKEVRARLKLLGAEVGKRGIARGLRKEAEAIMAVSKRQVPVDTGLLKSTGFVDEPKISRSSVTVELAYGGPAAPYAVRQHEDLTLRHKEGQKAKYLTDPIIERAPRIPRNLAQVLDGWIAFTMGSDQQ